MAETTTTTGTAPAAGGEGQTPQQTNPQPTAPTAEQSTAFQKFWQGGTGPRLWRGHQEGWRPGVQGGRGHQAGTPGQQELFRG